MPSSPLFRDRHDAGCQLAKAVEQRVTAQGWQQLPLSPVVYGLPRGGVAVAAPVAQALQCPLDVVIAKKITLPDHPEFAIGAVTADGQVMRARRRMIFGDRDPRWRQSREAALTKARAQWQQLAAVSPQIRPKGRLVVLVDDGIATGMTMAVAARSLFAKHPAHLLICAPVAPPGVVTRLQHWCDAVVVLATPTAFLSVSRYYADFPQVEMAEAIACLQHHNQSDLAGERSSAPD
jgi:predicted phosphoribosyltransferase